MPWILELETYFPGCNVYIWSLKYLRKNIIVSRQTLHTKVVGLQIPEIFFNRILWTKGPIPAIQLSMTKFFWMKDHARPSSHSLLYLPDLSSPAMKHYLKYTWSAGNCYCWKTLGKYRYTEVFSSAHLVPSWDTLQKSWKCLKTILSGTYKRYQQGPVHSSLLPDRITPERPLSKVCNVRSPNGPPV